MANNPNHIDNLQPFSKGDERINREGRPKKIYTILKESGYSADDMKDAFQEIGWQTIEDAQEIVDDPTKPLILKVIAKAFIRGADKGDFRYISEIIEQAIGKATEKREVKADVNIRSVSIELIPGSVPVAGDERDIVE